MYKPAWYSFNRFKLAVALFITLSLFSCTSPKQQAAPGGAATQTAAALAVMDQTQQARAVTAVAQLAATKTLLEGTNTSIAATVLAQAAVTAEAGKKIAATQTVEAIFAQVAVAQTATAQANQSSTNPISGTGAPLVIRLIYSPEKAAWLTPLLEQYNTTQRRLPNGRPIHVVATIANAVDAASAILDQGSQATIWFPTTSLELERTADTWRQRNGRDLTAEVSTLVVRSPLVIAMWEPMARLLGWPDKPLGWMQLADLAGKNWAEFAHPEWGAVKLGHTNPEFSASGLTALFASAYSALGKQAGLTTADLENPTVRTTIERIQQSIADYGQDTSSYAARIFDCAKGGPTTMSAAVLYESDVATQPTCPKRPKMVALYPTEGTFIADHPYAILQAPWVDADQQAGARDLLAFLLDTTAQQAAAQAGFRTTAAPLAVAQGIDLQEPRQLLALPDMALIGQTTGLWRQLKHSADVVLLFDRSGSMDNDGKIITARQGMIAFINLLSDKDRVQLIAFSGDQATLSPLSELGSKRSRLIEQIQSIRAEGATTLYDAMLSAYNDLQTNGDPKHIRAVVVMTDGRDERQLASGAVVAASQAKLDTVIKIVGATANPDSGIRLFTIAYGKDADNTTLKAMTKVANGMSFRGEPDTIQQIYQAIALFL